MFQFLCMRGLALQLCVRDGMCLCVLVCVGVNVRCVDVYVCVCEATSVVCDGVCVCKVVH